MEAFSYSNTTCRQAVPDFLDSWTAQLHYRGYVPASTAARARRSARSCRQAATPGVDLPDQLWFARWCSQPHPPTCYHGTERPGDPGHAVGRPPAHPPVPRRAPGDLGRCHRQHRQQHARRLRSPPHRWLPTARSSPQRRRCSTGSPVGRRSRSPTGSLSAGRSRCRPCPRASSTHCPPGPGRPLPAGGATAASSGSSRASRPTSRPGRRTAGRSRPSPLTRRRSTTPAPAASGTTCQRHADGAHDRADHVRHDGRPGGSPTRAASSPARSATTTCAGAGPLGRHVRPLDPAGRLAEPRPRAVSPRACPRPHLLRLGPRPEPGRPAVRLDRRPLPGPVARRPQPEPVVRLVARTAATATSGHAPHDQAQGRDPDPYRRPGEAGRRRGDHLPDCGKVAVLVDGKRIGTVTSPGRRATTVQVRMLPAFKRQRGDCHPRGPLQRRPGAGRRPGAQPQLRQRRGRPGSRRVSRPVRLPVAFDRGLARVAAAPRGSSPPVPSSAWPSAELVAIAPPTSVRSSSCVPPAGRWSLRLLDVHRCLLGRQVSAVRPDVAGDDVLLGVGVGALVGLDQPADLLALVARSPAEPSP